MSVDPAANVGPAVRICAAHELVELVKKESDGTMKKRIVSKLSLMNNKEATDYLIQLLEK